VPAALELITEHPNAYGRALAVAPDGQMWATCDGLRVKVMDAAGDVLLSSRSSSRSFACTGRLIGRSVEGRPKPLG
jgi:hypothetical protein